MDQAEVNQLRTVTEACALVDLAAGRRQGVITWVFVDTGLRTGLRVSELAPVPRAVGAGLEMGAGVDRLYETGDGKQDA